MEIVMQNKMIAVAQDTTTQKVGVVFTPNAGSNYGIVKYAHKDSIYPVGTKVFFGEKKSKIRINDVFVEVMEETNIVAVLKD